MEFQIFRLSQLPLAEQPTEQGNQGHADEGHTAACH